MDYLKKILPYAAGILVFLTAILSTKQLNRTTYFKPKQAKAVVITKEFGKLEKALALYDKDGKMNGILFDKDNKFLADFKKGERVNVIYRDISSYSELEDTANSRIISISRAYRAKRK